METKNIANAEETEIVNDEAAVAVLDDLAYHENLAEPPAQTAPLKTAVVKKTKSVRGKSSRTPSVTTQFIDPISMTDNELADIVVEGYGQFYRHLPYVITLWQRFQKKKRDGKNHLLEPIKGCHSFDEFCTKYLDHTPSAVYKALRQVMQPQPTDGIDKPKRKATAKSKLGSAPHVNEDHPEYARMQAVGLINEADETEFKFIDNAELPKESVPGQPAEEIVIRHRDGNIVPKVAASVDDIVRTNLAFVISSHRSLSAADKVQAIGELIAKLESERDFLMSSIDVVPVRPQLPVSTNTAEKLTEPTTVQAEPDSDPLCLTCPRCGNQEDIQAVQRKPGQRVRRYHCTKCGLKTACNSFKPQTGAPMEAAEARA
jgi:predicted RNA-binding Zn-ribbon protein involved in translation (DUF1610 family)